MLLRNTVRMNNKCLFIENCVQHDTKKKRIEKLKKKSNENQLEEWINFILKVFRKLYSFILMNCLRRYIIYFFSSYPYILFVPILYFCFSTWSMRCVFKTETRLNYSSRRNYYFMVALTNSTRNICCEINFLNLWQFFFHVHSSFFLQYMKPFFLHFLFTILSHCMFYSKLLIWILFESII